MVMNLLVERLQIRTALVKPITYLPIYASNLAVYMADPTVKRLAHAVKSLIDMAICTANCSQVLRLYSIYFPLN